LVVFASGTCLLQATDPPASSCSASCECTDISQLLPGSQSAMVLWFCHCLAGGSTFAWHYSLFADNVSSCALLLHCVQRSCSTCRLWACLPTLGCISSTSRQLSIKPPCR
jgi:hypothetical protein